MTNNFRLSADFIGVELSNATMRPEDLIPCFIAFLRTNAPQAMPVDTQEGDHWQEQASDDTYMLFDILDSIAPVGCYFGAHEGDGSCYGFWPFGDDAF